MLINKEKYEGKTVKVYAPFNGRFLGRLEVGEVINENVLSGVIPETGMITAYYLSDGIKLVVEDEEVI